MAQKPTDSRQLVRIAADAQRLLQKFIDLPFSDPEGATELLAQFDQKVAEFKRLQARLNRPGKARVLRLADAPARACCSICGKPIVAKLNGVKTKGAIYHRTCYSAVVDRGLRRSSP